MKLVPNKLRVVHYPNVPCPPFVVEVKTEEIASAIYEALADQHLFLFDNNFINDYANSITIEMWDEDLDPDENGEKWTDYWNEEEQMEWKEFKNTYITD